MTIWFTSDLHFGHQNILKYCDRPFTDLDHMHTMLVDNFNSVVQWTDCTVFVGDVAMGHRTETLPILRRMHGDKILVPGNHDDCHEMYGHKSTFAEKFALYEQFFDEIAMDAVYTLEDFVICHFPYNDGDTDYVGRRFTDWEPMDIGMPLLCGHVHETWKTKVSPKGSWMRNVGVDVNQFFPVPFDTLKEEYALYQAGQLL